MEFRGSHILSIDQFSRDDVEKIFDVARQMEPFAQRKKVTRVLEGAILGNLFFEPSTRSRISFGAAFCRLGGAVLDTTGFQFSSMAKGESVYDTSRVISGYVDVLVLRHPVEGAVREFADATHVPVINGGDGPGEHPTQALLDLYTIHKELGQRLESTDRVRVAMVGDLKYGRTVHSLTKLLALFDGIELTFVAPDELRMPEVISRRSAAKGCSISETADFVEGISDADVIYMTRIQQERFTSEEEANKFRGMYCLDKHTFEKNCKPSAVMMHPLPRDSRPGANELNSDLNEIEQLTIFRQTDNGIPVRMALFALLLGMEDRVHETARPVTWFVPEAIGVHDTKPLGA